MSVPRSPLLTQVLWGLAVVSVLYAFTIHRLWRLRRWAWWACWIPVIGLLTFGVLGLLAMLVDPKIIGTQEWVVLAILLGPSTLLVPLQWQLKRDWAALAREHNGDNAKT